jgi:thiamine biosynthesis lipoprotein
MRFWIFGSVRLCVFVSLWLTTSPWLTFDIPAQAFARFESTQPHMGTTVRVVLYASTEPEAERAAAAAFARVAALDATLSDYKPDSELSRLTRDAIGRPVKVSRDLFRVLDAAQGLAARTGGAFDITVGPLSQLWRRARRQVELPPPGDLAAARALSQYTLLNLDPKAHTASVARDGMRLDAGGIAKGFAADEALVVLRGLGVDRALVAVGGDLAIGHEPPDHAGWQVTLTGLGAADTAPGSPILVHDVGISTSGDAEQWVEISGQRYSHIVNPKTGLGLTGHQSVTVVAGDAMTSDMLATAVSVLGPDDGLRLIDDTPGVAALVGTASSGQESWRRSRAWRW